MTEPKVPIRLTMGWAGLPRGTELRIGRGKADDLIDRGIAEPTSGSASGSTSGYAAPRTGALSSYVRK